ncbi:Glutathione S-transferase family protein [Perilla frutescens var. hirtella]|uniref:Glutathione S-transferase n=1 Tax=Perilla frutescens var. hirtella TaxID=608512 RepID=A0AAD4IPB1_PERFH|nr:Glutathione S-transferase family protein [Perilla frutescens var. hirtella]
MAVAASDDVKLLGVRPSPYVIRVEMALKLKSVEYEFIETDPHNKNELLLQANPVHKKIPVLIHGNRPICESLVIVQYIDDFWGDGPSILPSDPYQRAKARFWATYVDDKLLPLFKELKEVKEKGAGKAIIEKMTEKLALLEEAFVSSCGKEKGFFGGDDVSYVDIVLGCYLGWMRAIEILMDVKFFDETSTPGLLAWAERLCSDSIVKDVIPSTQKLVDLARVKASSE